MKIFNIPNILSMFRIILVPIFLYYYYLALQTEQFIIPLIIIVLSGLSDFLDGYIARKYNQITDLGKILDPVADKLTQVVFAICLVFRFPFALVLLTIMVVKDFLLFINTIIVLKNNEQVTGALIYGKIATTVFYIAAFILLLMPGLESWVANTIIAITSAAMLMALVMYVHYYLTSIRNVRKESKDNI